MFWRLSDHYFTFENIKLKIIAGLSGISRTFCRLNGYISRSSADDNKRYGRNAMENKEKQDHSSETHGARSSSVQDLSDLQGQTHRQREVIDVLRQRHVLLLLDPLDLLPVQVTDRLVRSCTTDVLQ